MSAPLPHPAPRRLASTLRAAARGALSPALSRPRLPSGVGPATRLGLTLALTLAVAPALTPSARPRPSEFTA